MAYRRKQSMTRNTTFEEYRSPQAVVAAADDHHNPPPSLAAQAIRASSAHRDSSLSSAYGDPAYQGPDHRKLSDYSQDSTAYEYTSMNSLHESKHGFWGVLARKAKAILEDNNVARQFEDHGRNWAHMLNTTDGLDEFHQPYRSSDQKMDNPIFQKGSESIASSLNYIGGTIKNALEEGRTIVENKTADIIQETRKLQIRRKSSGYGSQNQATDVLATEDTYQSLTGQETQLKASRDVANAMAAKAKLLLRELKTVKADLTFSKERCAQLEEENKILRESRQKRDNHADDDLIRLQLETLLAEKGRLAHENSVYARENRFLREIVEYHQLTMQDVVYLDEDIEEVTEVNPIHIPSHSLSLALHAPSPAFSTPSTPTSEPTTPSRDPVVSSDACSVTVDTALVCADSSPSSSPTVGVRQRHGDPSPSSSPTAEGMRKKRSPNHQDN